MLTTVTCALLVLLGLPGCGEGAAGGPGGTQRYVIVSGGQSGVYYPTAGAIARLAQQANPNLRLDVQTSGGSVANARMIGLGDAHFALMQNDIAAYARDGQLMFESQAFPQILGVAALYPEHIQIVAHADSGIRTIPDLRGKRVAIGAIGSGTEGNAQQILEAYGLTENDLAEVHRLKASESRDYLQDQRVDAAFFTFGVGTAAIQELSLVSDVVFVPVEGEARQRLLARYPFYREAVIPAGAYEDLNEDVPTVSVMATLVVRDSVPAEVVTQVLTGMFDNVDAFRQTHARLRNVNLADARDNLTLPMHPGAEAFYAQRDDAGPAAAPAEANAAPEAASLQ